MLQKLTITKIVALAYYAIICAVLGYSAVETVFQGSILVAKNASYQQLNAERQRLLAEKYELDTIRTTHLALSHMTTTVPEDFVPITKPIVVQAPQTVASSQ